MPGDDLPSVRYHGPHGLLLASLGTTEICRASGWMTVHAAAYVTQEGRCRLVLGRSGAGKSTRVIHAVLQGASFLGEDRVWLRGSDLQLMPRDDAIRLLPDACARLGLRQSLLQCRDPDGKVRISLATLGIAAARPRAVDDIELLVERGGEVAGETEGRLQLLQALWEAIGRPFMPQARPACEAAVSRLLSTPTIRVARAVRPPEVVVR